MFRAVASGVVDCQLWRDDPNPLQTAGACLAQSMKRRYRIAAILSRLHRFLYALLGGRFVSHRGDADFLLLGTMGRRSNRIKTVALLYVMHHGDPAVIASFGGNHKAPNWLLNVRYNSNVTVQIGSDLWQGISRIAEPSEREGLWPKFVETYAGYERYQTHTTRVFPIVVITKTSG